MCLTHLTCSCLLEGARKSTPGDALGRSWPERAQSDPGAPFCDTTQEGRSCWEELARKAFHWPPKCGDSGHQNSGSAGVQQGGESVMSQGTLSLHGGRKPSLTQNAHTGAEEVCWDQNRRSFIGLHGADCLWILPGAAKTLGREWQTGRVSMFPKALLCGVHGSKAQGLVGGLQAGWSHMGCDHRTSTHSRKSEHPSQLHQGAGSPRFH